MAIHDATGNTYVTVYEGEARCIAHSRIFEVDVEVAHMNISQETDLLDSPALSLRYLPSFLSAVIWKVKQDLEVRLVEMSASYEAGFMRILPCLFHECMIYNFCQ